MPEQNDHVLNSHVCRSKMKYEVIPKHIFHVALASDGTTLDDV